MRPRRIVSLTPEEIRRRTKRLLLGLVAAGAALGLLFGGLAAYAGMWPPVLVVESGSMQHSDTTSEIGLLDTGDLAVIQAMHNPAEIVTYLAGRAAGLTSFGDYGDVIAFADPEPNETAVLVHRAFARVTHNVSGGFDVPELAALPRAEWWGTTVAGSNATEPYGLRSFALAGMGWRHDLTMIWDLTSRGANYSNDGFLTFGDQNLYRTTLRTDPWILPPAYVLARVRGEIPWLGLLRLTVFRSQEGCCASWGSTDPDIGAPGNSWLFLDLLLIAAIMTPVALDLLWGRVPLPRFLRRFSREEPASGTGPIVTTGSGPSDTHPEAISPPLAFLPTEEFAAWLQRIDARIERLHGSLTSEKDPQRPT